MNTPIHNLRPKNDTLPPPEADEPTQKDLHAVMYEAQLRVIFDDLALRHKSIIDILACPRLKTAKTNLAQVTSIDRAEFVLEELIEQNRGSIGPLINLI